MKKLTAEQELECISHLDAILEITNGVKLSTLLDSIVQQTQFNNTEMRALFEVIQKAINDSILSSFAQTGEQLKQILSDPIKQAEMRTKMDEFISLKKDMEVSNEQT